MCKAEGLDMKNYIDVLAFDLGASSGRGILGSFDGKRIVLEEVCRFSNSPCLLGNRTYWDILNLVENVKNGITRCKVKPAGIGLDTWGVDFGLLDKAGTLVAMPRSYRDDAFNEENMVEAIDFLGGSSFIYLQTYISNMVINPLFQLYSMKK